MHSPGCNEGVVAVVIAGVVAVATAFPVFTIDAIFDVFVSDGFLARVVIFCLFCLCV